MAGHPISHVHDGADGSGTVAHSATTGQTVNDHHPKSHLHDGSDGSGYAASFATYPRPTSFANLIAYYEADLFAGVADNTAVSAWNDLSGQGNDLAQATGSKQPTVQNNIFNGHPAVRCDGTDDRIFRAAFVGGALSHPYTIICAAKWRAVTATAFQLLVDGGAASGTYSGLFKSNANPGVYDLHSGSDVNDGAADTAAHVFAGIWNGASSKIRVDGGTGTAGNSGANTLAGISFGAALGGEQFPAPVDIAACAVFSGAVSVGIINAVARGFAARFGTTWTTAT